LLFYYKNDVFLLVFNYNPPVFHDHENAEPYIFHGNDLHLLGSRDVIGHVTIRFGICGFLLVVHCNLALLQRYKASKLHLPKLKAKSSLRMLRVT